MTNPGSTPLISWRDLRKNLGVAADVLDRALKRGRSGSLAHFEALAYLAETPETALPQSDIQAALGLSQSATSRMLSRLESSGYVRRVLSKVDGRAWVIELTSTGLNAITNDLNEFIPLFRIQIHDFAQSLMPFSTPGAASLLLSDAVADPHQTPTNELLNFGEAILSLSRDSVFVSEAMTIREILELHVMLEAAVYKTDEDVESLQEILLELEARIHDPKAFLQTDWQLHRRLLELNENELLKQLYSGLLAVLEESFEGVVPSAALSGYLVDRLSVNRQLVEAVASGDPDQIRAATQQHILTSRARETQG